MLHIGHDNCTVPCSQVKAALQLWDGNGSFLFTSSAGLYTIEDGSSCSEDSPVHQLGNSERTDRSASIPGLNHKLAVLLPVATFIKRRLADCVTGATSMGAYHCRL